MAPKGGSRSAQLKFMQLAWRLARRGYGSTSPNPMVGAVLVKDGRIIGRGWHRRAGEPHAEIEAIRDAQRQSHSPKGATLYVTLEPCSSHGRTPPCTDAIVASGIGQVVAGACDPNPRHRGAGFRLLRRAGIGLVQGVLEKECTLLNEAFNHWIVNQTPFVTVKAAMTLDGKIATAAGRSKWITGERARAYGMKLRKGADGILVGIHTLLADDPSLTYRGPGGRDKKLRRIVLDATARTPLQAKIVTDDHVALTTVVVSRRAPRSRVAALARKVTVVEAPLKGNTREREEPRIDLRWLLKRLGAEGLTSLLVEGGGEVNASFVREGLAHRLAFFYAPKIVGGRNAPTGVDGSGVHDVSSAPRLNDIAWQKLGPDLLLTARLK